MRVIKKINNNAAICLDDNNCELVAIGTGIGFPKVPYELSDLSQVQRTYYDVDAMYYELLNSIPEKVLNVAIKIVNLLKLETNGLANSNLIFTLADHINFAIERNKRNIKIETPFQYDVQNLYEVEYKIGLEALAMIKNDIGVRLPKSEASSIALHLINTKFASPVEGHHGYVEMVIDDVIDIISSYFKMYIDKKNFNFSRFVSHLQFLLKRAQKGNLISTENYRMFESVIQEYHDTYDCVLKIKEYLFNELNIELNDEEILYLVLHVNRLCVREDCYRKSITSASKNK